MMRCLLIIFLTALFSLGSTAGANCSLPLEPVQKVAQELAESRMRLESMKFDPSVGASSTAYQSLKREIDRKYDEATNLIGQDTLDRLISSYMRPNESTVKTVTQNVRKAEEKNAFTSWQMVRQINVNGLTINKVENLAAIAWVTPNAVIALDQYDVARLWPTSVSTGPTLKFPVEATTNVVGVSTDQKNFAFGTKEISAVVQDMQQKMARTRMDFDDTGRFNIVWAMFTSKILRDGTIFHPTQRQTLRTKQNGRSKYRCFLMPTPGISVADLDMEPLDEFTLDSVCVWLNFSLDGTRALYSAKGSIHIRNFVTHESTELFTHGDILDAVFSPDNSQIAILTHDGRIQIWEKKPNEP